MKNTMKKRSMTANKKTKKKKSVTGAGAVVRYKKTPVYRPAPHSSAMDELDVWPPVWKPLKECPEYRLIRRPLEDPPDTRFTFYFDTLRLTPLHEHELVIKQLQESRGYDLTLDSLDYGFKVIDQTKPERMETYLPSLTKLSQVVVKRINKRAKKYGELYEFHDIEKAVDVMKCYLLTFRVNQVSSKDFKTVQACVCNSTRTDPFVVEWRFKSEDDVIEPNSLPPNSLPLELEEEEEEGVTGRGAVPLEDAGSAAGALLLEKEGVTCAVPSSAAGAVPDAGSAAGALLLEKEI